MKVQQLSDKFDKKPDLSALVGRKLVPFFEDGECDKNASPIQAPKAAHSAINYGQKSTEVLIREFKNGYFENAKSIRVPNHKSNKIPKRSNKISSSQFVKKTTRRKKGKVQNSNSKSSKALQTLTMSRTHFADPQWLSRPSPDTIPMPKFLVEGPTLGTALCPSSDCSDSHSVATSDSSSSRISCSSRSSISTAFSVASSVSIRSPLPCDRVTFVPAGLSKSEPITPRRDNDDAQKTIFEQLLSGESFDGLTFDNCNDEKKKNLAGCKQRRRRSLPPKKREPRAISPSSSKSDQLSRQSSAYQTMACHTGCGVKKKKTPTLSDPENDIKWSSLSLDEILSPVPKSRNDNDKSPTLKSERCQQNVRKSSPGCCAPLMLSQSVSQANQANPAAVHSPLQPQRSSVSVSPISKLFQQSAAPRQYSPPARLILRNTSQARPNPNMGCKAEASAAAVSSNSLPSLPPLTPLLNGKY